MSLGIRHLRVTYRTAPTSFVYVIQAPPDTPIKVGYTLDVLERIATLQTGNPRTLKVLFVIPAPQRLESYFHRLLRPNKMVGEWFDGKGVPHFLENVERMAERMEADFDGVTVPDWRNYVDWFPVSLRRDLAKDNRDRSVTVRHVDPATLTEAELDRLDARAVRTENRYDALAGR